MSKFFYNVAIAIPLRQSFTYNSNQQIKPGTRVAVKFGSKLKLGIVIEAIKSTEIKTRNHGELEPRDNQNTGSTYVET